MPDNKKKVTETKTTQKKQVKPIKTNNVNDFKKKYFEYYDDIKISDRQDW